MTPRYVALLVFVFASAAQSQQMVTVAIASGSELTIQGRAIQVYVDKDKKALKADKLSLSAKSKRITVNGKRLDGALRLLSDHPLSVAGKKVNGELDVLVEDGRMTAVHPIELEQYVAGIVASEMPKSWPLEALKAQAIASRTYALYQKYRRIDKGYHLDSTVLDQVYGGLDKDHEKASRAASETEGVVLTYDAKLLLAYFHSTCGGETESAENGWGSALPYLPGSTCGYCSKAHQGEWRYSVSKRNLEKMFGQKKALSGLELGSATNSGRIRTITLRFGKKSVEMPLTDLRQKLGYSNLKSTLIERVDMGRSEVTFAGKGFGHGVGMCQWGADGMAEQGLLASDILSRYYPGSELRRMY